MVQKKRAAGVRRRRTAEEARSAILDAAERQLVASGPAGIRLQEVAAELGISHPTVLHHFGSREALVQAVVERVQRSIYGAVIEALQRAEVGDDSMARLLDRVFEAVSGKGYARVLLWLALSGMEHPDEREPLAVVVETAQEMRRRRRAELGSTTRAPPVEDTRFVIALATLALTAESVLGSHLFDNLGLPAGDASHARFRAWLARILVKHLEST